MIEHDGSEKANRELRSSQQEAMQQDWLFRVENSKGSWGSVQRGDEKCLALRRQMCAREVMGLLPCSLLWKPIQRRGLKDRGDRTSEQDDCSLPAKHPPASCTFGTRVVHPPRYHFLPFLPNISSKRAFPRSLSGAGGLSHIGLHYAPDRRTTYPQYGVRP